MIICDTCHWAHELRVYANGSCSMCCNIGVDGWEHWLDKGEAPKVCEDYCEKGEYVPTGIWAQFAKVVEDVAEEVGADEK